MQAIRTRTLYRLAVGAVLTVLGWAPLPAQASPAGEQMPEHADVRVLIDVSGSMRQNDPNNLRRPALRLLVGLMQPGTRAGVWTFAGAADELVARGEVDAAWKAQGTRLAERIDSPGQFTDIEAALDRAVADWRDHEPEYRRHVLLLTDGMVDVSKQPEDSTASRRRILEKLLSELRAMSVRVHAVALSERADHELLQRLSAATDGWYQKVDDAAQLQKSFLRIFEEAGRPDALPLVDNRFSVDRSVREATVLVFRRSEAAPTRLIAPDGEGFTDSDIAAGIAWRRDAGYDLITVSDPQVGEWRLVADVDPDNRVMVVTDLKLKTAELPNRIAVGESLAVVAHLTNRGNLINKRAFLDLLSLRAETGEAGRRESLSINDSGIGGDSRAADGYFTARLRRDRAADKLDLLVVAESETFVRQRRHVFSVVEPLKVDLLPAGDAAPAQVRITVDAGVVEADADVRAWQESSAGEIVQLTLAPGPDGELLAALDDPVLPLFARVLGRGRSGQVIERSYGPLFLPGVEPPAESLSETEPEPPTADEPVDSDDDTLNIALFVTANVVLVLGGGLFWWLRRRRRTGEGVTLVEEDGSPDSGGSLDEALDIAADDGGEERAA